MGRPGRRWGPAPGAVDRVFVRRALCGQSEGMMLPVEGGQSDRDVEDRFRKAATYRSEAKG